MPLFGDSSQYNADECKIKPLKKALREISDGIILMLHSDSAYSNNHSDFLKESSYDDHNKMTM